MLDVEQIFQESKRFWTEKSADQGAIFWPNNLMNIPLESERAAEDILSGYPPELLADATVLDFGCGEGRLIPYISPKVHKYVGIDASPICLDRARELTKDLPNVFLHELYHSYTLWTDIGFTTRPEEVNLFVSWNVFQHLPHELLQFILTCVFSRLSSGGRAHIQIDWPPVDWNMPRELKWRWDQISDNDFRCRWWPDWMLWSILEKVGFEVLEAPSPRRECWRMIK